jgi:hypothetical protein
MQDIVGVVRQKLYIQGAGPSLSQPREQLPALNLSNIATVTISRRSEIDV